MVREGIHKRFIYPVVTLLIAAVLSSIIYTVSYRIENRALHQFTALVFGTFSFISVAFGTFYVYTVSYIRGAGFGERILASSVTPFIWMTKEVVKLLESHPLAECLYWYFNPLNFWLISLMVLEMGISTLIARAMLNRRGDTRAIVTAGPLAAIICSLAVVIGAYAWGRGENLYVIFLKGYRMIFGTGL